MITSKRRTPTTDELLRRQEEPQKRHKRPSFAQDEDEDNNTSENDDFDAESAPDDEGVEWDGFECESGFDESTDSEIGKESSSLLGSRVTVKPRLVHQSTLSPDAGKPVTFISLGISPPLLSALSKMAIRAPTEIQRACIPPLLAGQSLFLGYLAIADDDGNFSEGRDCIGNAKTGSGKTIAFALPILQKLSVDPYGIFALVLTPTRYRNFIVIVPQFS
jgi:ATP-dependent RNA helicase DDX49/DBP8